MSATSSPSTSIISTTTPPSTIQPSTTLSFSSPSSLSTIPLSSLSSSSTFNPSSSTSHVTASSSESQSPSGPTNTNSTDMSSSSTTATSSRTSTSSTSSTIPSSSSTSSPHSSTSQSTDSSTTTTSQTSSSSSTSGTQSSTVSPTPPVSLTTTQPLPTIVTQIPPTTTFKSTFVVTVTDGNGGVTISVPSIYTAVVTSTAHNGTVVTVTQVGINQTLSPDKHNSDASVFFRNTGAVAGVFVLVGLAAASILLWILFAIRRRRRNQRLNHDSAVFATLAAAGFRRPPLNDGDTDDGYIDSRPMSEMNQHSMSAPAIGTASITPSAARTSAYIDSPRLEDGELFNPYQDYLQGGTRDSYVPGTGVPLASHYGEQGAPGGHAPGHSASQSVASYEPLLASYYRPARSPTPPARDSLRLSDAGRTPPLLALSLGSSDLESEVNNATTNFSSFLLQNDNRLDPRIRRRSTGDIDLGFEADLRDEEDYSRPILGIRNLPDGVSRDSH